MGISTVSFDKARIYQDKMFFISHGRDSVCTNVLDNRGNYLVRKISHKAVKTVTDKHVVLERKNEYVTPDNNILFELLKRVYDKAGKLIRVEKTYLKR